MIHGDELKKCLSPRIAVVYKFFVERILRKKLPVAKNEELFAGSGDCNIEFAVDIC